MCDDDLYDLDADIESEAYAEGYWSALEQVEDELTNKVFDNLFEAFFRFEWNEEYFNNAVLAMLKNSWLFGKLFLENFLDNKSQFDINKLDGTGNWSRNYYIDDVAGDITIDFCYFESCGKGGVFLVDNKLSEYKERWLKFLQIFDSLISVNTSNNTYGNDISTLIEICMIKSFITYATKFLNS